MNKPITYHFTFRDGSTWSHQVTLTRHALPHALPANLPEWTSRAFLPCDCGCTGEHCLVAVQLVEPVRRMGEIKSYEDVEVRVESEERIYLSRIDLQGALSSLLGLIMAASGAPALAIFRPLAWFHLPFSTYEETLFRMVSAYLLRTYLQSGRALGEEQLIAEIDAIYTSVAAVNKNVVARLRKAAVTKADAAYNAVVILDSFAMMVPMSLRDRLEELKDMFLN